MKKAKILVMIVIAAQLVSCGSANTDSTEYSTFAGLEEANVLPVSETENTEEYIPGVSDVKADAETQERTITADSEVYSQPDVNAAVIGNVQKGDRILVFGETEDHLFYQIVYDGRVAYVVNEVIKEKKDEDSSDDPASQDVDRGQGAGVSNPAADRGELNNQETNNPSANNPETNNQETNNPPANNQETNNSETNNQETNNPGTNNSETNNPETNNPGTNNSGADNSETNNPGTNNPGTNSSEPGNSETNNSETNNSGTDTSGTEGNNEDVKNE